jgi:hypothetical protein
MTQIGRTAAFIAIALLCASGASALDDQAANAPDMPRWDADVSIGLLSTRDLEGNRYNGYGMTDWDNRVMAAYVFGAGHFWTQHIKSDVGVTLTRDQRAFDIETYSTPAVPPGAFAYTNRTSRFTTISGALTYQFFENAFVHPYVAGGVNLEWIREHRFRDETTTTVNRVRYAIPAVDERDNSLLVRPIVAVGCKSYFNGRTFVRTEALVAFGSSGASLSTVRIGVGVDF